MEGLLAIHTGASAVAPKSRFSLETALIVEEALDG
jgi:hypothetical protein